MGMAFVTDDGEPFYPPEYKVKKLKDCAADVSINGIQFHLTCMPDRLTFGTKNTDIVSDG
jgi:hypothetical protein